MLQHAVEVKHLEVMVELYPRLNDQFPDIDLVLFNSHPKLCKFEINGIVLEMLSLEDYLFVIPCLEEVMITVRSPLNPEQSLSTLECLVKYNARLRRVRLRRMGRTMHNLKAADVFSQGILKFMDKNSGKVFIK
ncbi:hypothetical protein EJB05_07336, partial [Eragrostis curvula]